VPLHLNLLGELSVERGADRLPLPPSKKTRALLAYLLAEPREHTRERLCNLLWENPDDPRGALRWSLSRIRALFEDTPVSLLAEGERVTMTAAGAEVDLLAVREIFATGLKNANSNKLREAADRFRGQFLEGLELPDCYRFQAWCTSQRETTRRWRLELLETLADRLGEADGALAVAREILEVDPSREPAHRRVMALLLASGNRKEALRQYDVCRAILREQGARPSEEMEALRVKLGPEPAVIAVTKEKTFVAPRVPERPAAGLPLVGRESEWRALTDALDPRAPNRLVLILGEPGIGKSRLCEELVFQTGVDRQLLRGRSYEAELSRPYGCFIDAFRSAPDVLAHARELGPSLASVLPELGTTDEAGDRGRFLDAVAELLRRAARQAPVVVLLDDAQWMDEASALLAHYLVRTMRSDPVRILISARAGELPDNAAARRMLGALSRQEMVTEIRLGPLTIERVRELLRSRHLSADADRVHAASQGNPFYALEVGRSMSEGREGGETATLARALDERFASLDEEKRSLLRWAAAVGRQWPPGLLASAAGRPLESSIEALDVLERHGLIRALPNGEDYDFVHDLVREAIWNRVPPAQRRLYHGGLARALWATADGQGAQAGAVVRHALGASDELLAVRASVPAARYALRTFAISEAIRSAEQGLELHRCLPEQERLRVQLALSEILIHARVGTERSQRLVAELRGLVAATEAAGMTDVVAEALETLSFFHYFAEHEEQAFSNSLRSAELAREIANPLVRARGLAQAGRCLAQAEAFMEKAGDLLHEARSLVPAEESVLDIPLGLGLVSVFLGENDQARDHLDQVVRLAETANDLWRGAEAAIHLALLAIESGEAKLALERARRAVKLSGHLTSGHEPPLAGCLLAIAELMVAFEDGRQDDAAEARFSEHLAELRGLEAHWRAALVLIVRAEVALAQGRPSDAREFASAALPRKESEATYQARLGRCHAVLAEAALALGDLDSARDHLARSLSSTGTRNAAVRARLARTTEALERLDPAAIVHTDLQPKRE
jgi:DNA-binding SARP family transcriptional activator